LILQLIISLPLDPDEVGNKAAKFELLLGTEEPELLLEGLCRILYALLYFL